MKDFNIVYDEAVDMAHKMWPLLSCLGTPMELKNPAVDFTKNVRAGLY